jgi:magnesium-transporting ATPase (P-type)
MEQTWLAYLATLDVAGVYDELHTRRGGLTPDEVERSREENGENRMAQMQRTPAPIRLLMTFTDPFVLILLALGAVSFATSFMLPETRGVYRS